MQRDGVIVRALSGFYTVRCGSDTVECRARGKFRFDGMTPLVGDRVSIRINPDGSGTLDALYPRSCYFDRPAVSNVELLVAVASCAVPITEPYLLDRVSVLCEAKKCAFLIVVNKDDIAGGEPLRQIYEKTGYPVVVTRALTGEGVPALRRLIAGKICVFTGNTGVGKTSLINALCPGLQAPTGEISEKLGRGKHTTRHVELYDAGDNTLIADTPGFSSFDEQLQLSLRKTQLAPLFPEFAPYLGRCRFDDCVHIAEPGCELRRAVEEGKIHPSRYESYKRMVEEASRHADWEFDRR